MESKKNAFDFNSTNLLLFLWHWRKTLIIVVLSAIVLSAVFSSKYFITPKYKSSVIMFPVSTNSISKALISSNTNGKQDIMEFGAEEQAEQMLQILYSSKIKQRVISKYHLFDHYDIDSNSSTKMTDLYKEFESNITFKRTEFMAVEVTVLDKDPQMAADIANNISDLVDTVKNEIQKERAIEGYKITEREYNSLLNEMKITDDSLFKLRTLGITDYESQAERFNQQYAIALANGNMQGAKRIKQQLDTLAKYGGGYVALSQVYESQVKQLAELKAKYNEAKVDAQQNLPQKFMVERAYKAEKKSYPVRWLLVLVTTFSAFILAVLSIIIIQTIRNYDIKPIVSEETKPVA
jgi:capsular polysaccharide biosynthesis protein